MHWNYRVLKGKDGYLRLREVFYDERGRPFAFADSGLDIVVEDDDIDDLIGYLKNMLKDTKDCKKKRMMSEKDFGKKGKYHKNALCQQKKWKKEMKEAKPYTVDELLKKTRNP